MLSLRRNLGRLTVLGDLFSNSIYTNYTTKTTTSRKIKSSYAFPTIFNSFNAPSSYGGYTECEHYHSEAETVGESDRTFVRSITKGDTICLNDLLFTNNRDYLVRNNGQHVKAEQLEGKVIGIYFVPLFAKDPPQYSAWYTTLLKEVPIHTFEDKVVALYFYYPYCPDSPTEELKLAYEKLAKIKKKFEVVLVYIYEPRERHHWRSEQLLWKSEESFWEKFKTMPWLALPFKDTSYKKLMRVFEFQSNNALGSSLVIFGPRADYIEPFGLAMLRNYGIGGYPFTIKKAAELENEKTKELKLEMLWDPNTVFKGTMGPRFLSRNFLGRESCLFLKPLMLHIRSTMARNK